MTKLIAKWLKIYEDELGLLASAVALLFLVRISGMLFTNFAETAFLKRFGVQYLPVMYMINSVAIFVIMGFIAGAMARLPGTKLLLRLLVICCTSVAAMRFVIPFGYDLVYPVLFTLKTLYEALLGLLFWNLANDLFNTRQSKRLFPLITAGGVCGDILGGFGTPFLTRLVFIDNLLLVYLATTLAAAVVVRSIGSNYPTLLIQDTGGKKRKARSSIIQEIKQAIPLLKESVLIKILVFMTFFPHVIIPIMNYLFNFAVNEQFATEGGLVTFFGYFRGGMNVISLIILLFVGRIYGRWGLPVALMFHPCNYLFVFIGFLVRFDIIAAIYARLSTNVIRTTLHKPASDVLMGLVPMAYRAVLRPFLRGTVVRIALVLGSAIILATENLFHPRYLALIALPFVIGWLATIITLKRRYSGILLDLISRNLLDLKSMEQDEVGDLFRDRTMRERLAETYFGARGKNAVWYARLMQSLGVEGLDDMILESLKTQDEHTRAELIDMVSMQAGAPALPALAEAAASDNAALTAAALRALDRLDPSVSRPFDYSGFLTHPDPDVRAYAVVGLYRRAPDDYRDVITTWLASDRLEVRQAGVIAAGETHEPGFFPRLKQLLDDPDCAPILPDILRALQALRLPDQTAIVLPYLDHPREPVRQAALEAVDIDNDDSLQKVINLVGDSSDRIRQRAVEKIETAEYQNSMLLVESLTIPRRRTREGIFELLDSLNIKDLDAFRFARDQIEAGYQYLADAERLKRFEQTPEIRLFIDHLNQKRMLRVENTLRVLAAQDRSKQRNIIIRGVFSDDPRQRANGIEALEDAMDRKLSEIMIPIIEVSSPEQTLSVGRKNFTLTDPDMDDRAFVKHLVAQDDWIATTLMLSAMDRIAPDTLEPEDVTRLAESENSFIARTARAILARRHGNEGSSEDTMQNETAISDKILLLKGIEIFEGLSVGELAAVASVSEEEDYPSGAVVIQEGDPGETMYLIIRGEVSVIKGLGSDNEIELDRIREGDYFGEMALFENIARTASIRTETPSRLLILHKQEFKEIVREYPQIALEICRALSGRIRRLHDKIRK